MVIENVDVCRLTMQSENAVGTHQGADLSLCRPREKTRVQGLQNFALNIELDPVPGKKSSLFCHNTAEIGSLHPSPIGKGVFYATV